MSTSDERVTDDTLSTDGPTGPGPGSTHAVSPTAGSGESVPDTGPGPAAADVDGPSEGESR